MNWRTFGESIKKIVTIIRKIENDAWDYLVTPSSAIFMLYAVHVLMCHSAIVSHFVGRSEHYINQNNTFLVFCIFKTISNYRKHLTSSNDLPCYSNQPQELLTNNWFYILLCQQAMNRKQWQDWAELPEQQENDYNNNGVLEGLPEMKGSWKASLHPVLSYLSRYMPHCALPLSFIHH